MTKSKFPFSAIVGIVFVIAAGLMSHFQCDRARTIDEVTLSATSVDEVLDVSSLIDSLKTVNMGLRMANDSLVSELETVNLELANREVQTVTRVVYRYRSSNTVLPDSTELLALQDKLDSMYAEHANALDELQLTNAEFETVAREMNNAIAAAAATPCTFRVDDDHLHLNATCTNGVSANVDVTVPDTLTFTHTVEKPWFLGRKTFHVYAEHENPHVELDGKVYVIDRKLQRRAARAQRRANRN